jgi:hypothetical protein
MDITQLNAEIQKLIDESPDKALQNVLAFLRKVRSSSTEQGEADYHSTQMDSEEEALVENLDQKGA